MPAFLVAWLRRRDARCNSSEGLEHSSCGFDRLHVRRRVWRGDGTAAGPDWRRVWTAGSTAAVKALNDCKLMSRAAGESENSVRAACSDRSRDAATAFAASVSREGWPNGAKEA